MTSRAAEGDAAESSLRCILSPAQACPCRVGLGVWHFKALVDYGTAIGIINFVSPIIIPRSLLLHILYLWSK